MKRQINDEVCICCLEDISNMFERGKKDCAGAALAFQQKFIDALQYAIKELRKKVKNGEDAIVIKLAEQQTGEWLYGEDNGQDGWFCSKCEFFVPWYYQYYENDVDFIRDYKACPHCLAKMVTYTGKGGEEDERL